MPKLLFVTLKPFFPDSVGGAQRSALYLFESLMQRGWQIEVICALSLTSPTFKKSYRESLRRFELPNTVIRDEQLGFVCWRRLTKISSNASWLALLDKRLDEFKPDVVLGDSSPRCPLLNHALKRHFVSVYFARNLNITEVGSIIPPDLEVIANSPFLSSIVSKIIKKQVEVVLPFVNTSSYGVQERQRKYITFINPVPAKGVDIATQVAQELSEYPFLFIKGKWSDMKAGRLENWLRTAYDLPNVEIWQNQSDMKSVYGLTDILLVPSQFVETFGRVILEAQSSSIPVVASDIGGIDYSLGQGGILVSPRDDVYGYIEAIKKLKSDENYYTQLSKLALENSNRPEFDPEKQVDKFVIAMERIFSQRNKEIQSSSKNSIDHVFSKK